MMADDAAKADGGSNLTPNQRRFVAEYAIDRNATRAYLRAFPRVTYDTAKNAAHRLLTNDNIRREIEAATREHARRCGISARRTLRELAGIAFADFGDLFDADPHTGLPRPRDWSDVPPATRRAVQSVKVKKRRIRSTRYKEGRETVTEVEEVEEVEYKLHPKMDALKVLCEHQGLVKDAPALREALDRLREADGEAQATSPPEGEAGDGDSSGDAAQPQSG
jgi:hypothetical protein